MEKISFRIEYKEQGKTFYGASSADIEALISEGNRLAREFPGRRYSIVPAQETVDALREPAQALRERYRPNGKWTRGLGIQEQTAVFVFACRPELATPALTLCMAKLAGLIKVAAK